MVIQIEEFKKVANEVNLIYVCILDGQASMLVMQHGVSSLCFHLGTFQGKTKTFKSFSALTKFVSKHQELLNCQMIVNFSDIPVNYD